MKRIGIIGGGISGLAAAFYLERARRSGVALHYTLFEATQRLGGVVRTERLDGCLVEGGPDSFLTDKQAAATLCRDLGIEDQLIGSNDAQRKTFILIKDRLVPIPEGLQFLVPTRIVPALTTPLFSATTKLRMAKEYFARPRRTEEDESAAQFVERHFGPEMVERLADPLLAGVYGGEAARLSARAVLPRFVEMEARHGSLSRALLAARRRMSANGAARPIFTSLRDGMQQLVDRVTAQLDPSALRLGVSVRAVGREQGQWLVLQQDGSVERFDFLVLAVPAYVAGALLRTAHPPLAKLLSAVPYSSSVTVALGYDAAAFDARPEGKLPQGFGFLIPHGARKRMLACTLVHNKFPHRAPEDRLLLRVFLGGSRDEAVLALDDEEIVRTVRRELWEILSLGTEPCFTRVYRWPRAMAQYEVGHLARVAEIEGLRAELPGLALAGNAYRGIGVPDCIRSGRDAAEEIIKSGDRVIC
ncbi:MAG TPA: protoporphyrinogen oxidase [Terriglobales bacterium]|nr:protoporphyrinogen oxidase [Terriglobales bacterium]